MFNLYQSWIIVKTLFNIRFTIICIVTAFINQINEILKYDLSPFFPFSKSVILELLLLNKSIAI